MAIVYVVDVVENAQLDTMVHVELLFIALLLEVLVGYILNKVETVVLNGKVIE